MVKRQRARLAPNLRVELRRALAQLEHVAQHSDAPPVARHSRKRLQGGDHGRGIRVVGIVDERDAVALDDMPPPSRQREVGQSLKACVQRHAEPARASVCDQRVEDIVPPGQAHLQRLAQRRRFGIGERHRLDGRGAHPHEAVVAVVLARQHGKAVRRQTRQQCALFVGDAVLRTEKLDVRCADGGDEADVRRGDVGEVGDLARMVRAHLDDEEVGVGRTVQHRQRQAEIVVEIAGRGVGLEASGAQKRRRQLLDGGLAGRARNAHDLRLQGLAIGPGEIAEAQARIGDAHQAGFVHPRRAGPILAHQRTGRAGGQRLFHERMAVGPLALERHIQHARPDLPGVECRAVEMKGKKGAPRMRHALFAFLSGGTVHSAASSTIWTLNGTVTPSPRSIFAS